MLGNSDPSCRMFTLVAPLGLGSDWNASRAPSGASVKYPNVTYFSMTQLTWKMKTLSNPEQRNYYVRHCYLFPVTIECH